MGWFGDLQTLSVTFLFTDNIFGFPFLVETMDFYSEHLLSIVIVGFVIQILLTLEFFLLLQIYQLRVVILFHLEQYNARWGSQSEENNFYNLAGYFYGNWL